MFSNVSTARQAAEVSKQYQEKEHRERSNYLNIHQLAEIVYENQKTSNKQFITTVVISVLTLLFSSIACLISILQMLR